LIPIAGVIGAAYATLISAILAFLLFTVFGHRYYHIPYKTKKLLFSFILTLVSAYGILKILNQINLISAIIKLIYIFLIIIVISSLLIERKHLEKIKLIKGISS
jgi:O-antigen/teichoic acid export membrane protein